MTRQQETPTDDDVLDALRGLSRDIEDMSTDEAPALTPDEETTTLRKHVAHTSSLPRIAALSAMVLSLSGCAALSSLLGLAGPVAGAVGGAVGAYESAVNAQASAAGKAPSDPAVLAALAAARKLDARIAADSKARDEAEAKRLADALIILGELRSRPTCPTALPAVPTSTAWPVHEQSALLPWPGDGGAAEGGR